MNANADTNIKPTSAEIEKRIADERNRLNAELGLQGRLQAQRLPALETGDDDALNVIEANLTGCLDRQSRIEERIELLTSRLEETKERDESLRLDEVTAGAERARERGTKILKTVYPRIAKQLADALAELRDCEQSINQANYELQAAKRETVESADPKRYAGPPGPLGLIVGYLALHELISLPNEQSPDAAPYWQCTDTLSGLALYALNVPGQRKLLTP